MTTMLAALALAAVTVQAAAVNPQAAALAEFSQRLKAYVALRAKLANRLEPLSPTASANDLQARQAALAAALRSARARARPGDLIPQSVRQQIRETVAADFRRRQPSSQRAALEEVPTGPLPGINKNYPERAALPTAPPLLLQELPPLPDNLQYRFFGRHLIILDGDVEIVVDYVQNVLPRS
jgi:hypothetical protein